MCGQRNEVCLNSMKEWVYLGRVCECIKNTRNVIQKGLLRIEKWKVSGGFCRAGGLDGDMCQLSDEST